jgi:cold shock CspA family protein
MHDRIVEGYLKDFVTSEGMGYLGESGAFERFINFCIISRDHPEPFEVEDISVGGAGDLGIDGIAVLVNEHLVASTEDVDFFKKQLRRLDVRFVFIQTKTSTAFDSGDIGNFLFGVRTFFQERTLENEHLRRAKELKEHIYDSSIDMDRAPICDLYYATLGKWMADAHVSGRIESDVQLLKDTNLFCEVRFTPLDADGIKSVYRELKRKVVKEIVFEKHTILPKIDRIQEAYIGVLPAKEYLSLICDADGRLQRSLFYDNVRDFQGNNPVNQEILETLKDPVERDKFTVLNNGITVVAQSLNKVGSTFKLKDFQIVNGCQTSHVLFSAKALAENVQVPLKLIVTNDPEVTNLIIKGTNRQTEVKIEAFESLNPFQKDLEEFYTTVGQGKDDRLYYERRSKQYDHLPIKPHQIITLTAQVKSFIAMFLNEPHSTHRYYGELLDANRSRIFLPDHSPFPYYVSGYAMHVADRFFFEGRIDRKYKKYKFQLLMLFRLLAETQGLPYLNSTKSMDKYCSALMEVLSTPDRSAAVFKRCLAILDEKLGSQRGSGTDAVRLRAFTIDLIDFTCAGKTLVEATAERERGEVVWFSDIKGYGFIRSETRDVDVFVHFTAIRGDGYRSLREGEKVEFATVQSKRGTQAGDVIIAPPSREENPGADPPTRT